jgi:hypothetical protein
MWFFVHYRLARRSSIFPWSGAATTNRHCLRHFWKFCDPCLKKPGRDRQSVAIGDEIVSAWSSGNGSKKTGLNLKGGGVSAYCHVDLSSLRFGVILRSYPPFAARYPFRIASASLMYSPRLVFPYHCWPGRKHFPELVFTQTLASVATASSRESVGAEPFAPALE